MSERDRIRVELEHLLERMAGTGKDARWRADLARWRQEWRDAHGHPPGRHPSLVEWAEWCRTRDAETRADGPDF